MERWDLRDGEGNPTGETMERGEHLKPGQYHLVVHIWIIDGQGRLLIQKRAAHLKLMPDIWAATGGSAVAGEDSHTAAAGSCGRSWASKPLGRICALRAGSGGAIPLPISGCFVGMWSCPP